MTLFKYNKALNYKKIYNDVKKKVIFLVISIKSLAQSYPRYKMYSEHESLKV